MSAIEGASFWVAADNVPRLGEFVLTQNKKLCEVTHVNHSVVPIDMSNGERIFTLVTYVAAVLDESA